MLVLTFLLLICAESTDLTLANAKATEVGVYFLKDERYQNKIPASGELTIASNASQISDYQCGMFCQMFPGCLAFISYNGSCVGYDTLFIDKTYDILPSTDGVQYYEISDVFQDIALGKPTGESSAYHLMETSAENLVSGRRGGSVIRGYSDIYHSDNSVPKYIWVDLRQKYFITHIKVTNRCDCCWDRFQDISVSVGDTLDDLEQCWSYKGPPETASLFVIPCEKIGRFVKLQKFATDYLNLCAMEVSGHLI